MKTPEVLEDNEDREAIDPVLTIKRTIENSRERVKREFSRTDNDWLACFITDLTAISTIIQMKLLPAHLQGIAEEQYATLYGKVRSLQKIYPMRRTVPPLSVRNELFEALEGVIG